MAAVWTAFVVAGCGRGDRPAPVVTATVPAPFVPQSGSNNAFDGYALAALQVEEDAPKQLLRTGFLPDQRQAAIDQSQRGLAILRRASRLDCTFAYRPRKPFEPAPYHRGWRLLGRVLAWHVQSAAAAGDYPAAVSDALVATRFGFDLMGGSAIDASLGLTTVDEARRAIAPYLAKMPSGDLAALSEGLRHALARKPSLETTFQNERQNMTLAVAAVEEAFLANRSEEWAGTLSGDVRDTFQHMEEFRGKPEKERAFFTGFLAEADETTQALIAQASMPTKDRPETVIPEEGRVRPWRRLARHLLRAGVPLLKTHDATLARTRMAILTCELIRTSKTTGTLPNDLGGFPAELATDPYSGRRFVYHAEPPDFALYSFGTNLQDDGGETDGAFAFPDLVLERP